MQWTNIRSPAFIDPSLFYSGLLKRGGKIRFWLMTESNFEWVLSLGTWPATVWEQRMQRGGGWDGRRRGDGVWRLGGRGGENSGPRRGGGGGSWGGLSHDLNSPVWVPPYFFLVLPSLQTHADTHTPLLANICIFGPSAVWPFIIMPTKECEKENIWRQLPPHFFHCVRC